VIFLDSTEFRPVLPPPPPPASCTTASKGCFPGSKVVRAVKLTFHLRLVMGLGMVELYFHFPLRLHGAVLNELSIGIIMYIKINKTLRVQLA
jgi:hypothetical protein